MSKKQTYLAIFFVIVIIVYGFSFVSCGSGNSTLGGGSEKPFLGKWQWVGGDRTGLGFFGSGKYVQNIEFLKGGTAILNDSLSLPFKVLDGTRLQLSDSTVIKYTFSQDQLNLEETWQSWTGKDITYRSQFKRIR